MKVILCLCISLSLVLARPQERNREYQTNDAIQQAKISNLLPKDAHIHKVDQGIEIAAYEGIPGGQRVDLAQILGKDFPSQVIQNLQVQIDSIGTK